MVGPLASWPSHIWVVVKGPFLGFLKGIYTGGFFKSTIRVVVKIRVPFWVP